MLALCSCSEEGENISTEDNLIEITFATDWKAQAEQGGFYQALAAGLYEKNGLKVKIIQGSANVNVPRLIASNSVEFGIGSNSFIPLNMVANKIPGKAVMAIFQKDPQIIMTHPDSDIRNLKDMRDLPIMISDASIGAFWLWLKSKYDFNDNQIRKLRVVVCIKKLKKGNKTRMSQCVTYDVMNGADYKVRIMVNTY